MAGHSDCCPQISTAEAQSQLNHEHKDRSWSTTKQGNTRARSSAAEWLQWYDKVIQATHERSMSGEYVLHDVIE